MAGSESLAVQRRRESRHEEYATQREVVGLLARHLDPAKTFFSSLENLPRSPVAAIHQQRRGCKRGLPDIAVLHNGGRAVFLELKSRRGSASAAQREVAAAIQASGASWYLARTARAALTALALAGVSLGRWRPPKALRAWEGPFSDPNQRLPQHPRVAREQRAARRRWRARQRAREAARRSEQPVPMTPGLQPVANDARQA